MSTERIDTLCRYHYDPLDRLVDCTPAAQARTQRFYLKERLASEIEGSVQRSIFQHDDQLLAQQQRENAISKTTVLAIDQQRSVLQMLDATQPYAFAYTAYGHRPHVNGLLGLLAFNGERPDPVTGHYLLGNGYRAFNPVLMRFNSPDSLSPFGKGGLNAYAYCTGDPVNKADPSGHFPNVWKGLLNLIGLRTAQRYRTPLGAFEKIKGVHVVYDEIFSYLPGSDMASLAKTSQAMKQEVYSMAKSPVHLFKPELGEASIESLKSAARGHMNGIVPAHAIEMTNAYQQKRSAGFTLGIRIRATTVGAYHARFGRYDSLGRERGVFFTD
ncbi:RHS repeat-associated core domain-containing protein [Pseudomonas sp. Z4-7]|uniref:RHS repeat-associated core domain-containing protein n=1 Tax=unclassified Pseudomonas TaxID=196821 RepID=UPI003DA8AB80